jgi:anti-sigma factor RsiW
MDDKGSIIMKCPMEENAEVLLACCAGKLNSETQIILERHLAVCPACREFMARQEAVWQALDSWEAMPVSPDFDRRLYRRIEEEAAHASWWSRLVRPFRPMFAAPLMSRSVPLAAAACLLVLAGVIMERPNGELLTQEGDRTSLESNIQPDQVERTLDDMEMLRQFRVNQANESGSVNSM